MSLDYAYTLLETKELDEGADEVIVKGIASTPTPDRSLDIVEPMGAKFTTPMPLLWMHDMSKPVGNLIFAKPNKDGIPFEARIPRVKEAGLVKDRVDEAIHSLKYKLVAAVSIGFAALEYSFMENGGVHFKEWEWRELSLVTIPANPDAKIELVKSIDRSNLTAIGRERQSREHLKSGVSGHRKPIQLIKRSRS